MQGRASRLPCFLWRKKNMNSILFNIPSHSGCRNCGKCCGIVPASLDEIERIKIYISDKPEISRSIISRLKADETTCPFRCDGRCVVHEVRPIICRLFGVTRGMYCEYGNSHEIDGSKFLFQEGTSDYRLLNDRELWK
jgi:Fe-S-cluster containining protein